MKKLSKVLTLMLCVVLGLSFSGIALGDAASDAKAKAEKAAKVKFKWLKGSKGLKSAEKQSADTGLPIVLLFTGTSWCPYCMKLEKEVLAKKEFKKGMDGVALAVKFEFASSGDIGKSKEAQKYGIHGVPCMVVVDEDGKELGRLGYRSGVSPDKYVEEIGKYSPKKDS